MALLVCLSSAGCFGSPGENWHLGLVGLVLVGLSWKILTLPAVIGSPFFAKVAYVLGGIGLILVIA
jgi:hypothetical protein